MSSLSIATARLLAFAFLVSSAAAFAADPPRKTTPTPAQAPKAVKSNCGDLPRGGKAYKECINAEARRDPREFKPAFSSR